MPVAACSMSENLHEPFRIRSLIALRAFRPPHKQEWVASRPEPSGMDHLLHGAWCLKWPCHTCSPLNMGAMVQVLSSFSQCSEASAQCDKPVA